MNFVFVELTIGFMSLTLPPYNDQGSMVFEPVLLILSRETESECSNHSAMVGLGFKIKAYCPLVGPGPTSDCSRGSILRGGLSKPFGHGRQR